MHRLPLILSLFTTLLVAWTPAAAETSIAVIDFERALSSSEATAATREAVQAKGQDYQQRLRDLQEKIKQVKAELETLPETAESYPEVASRAQVLQNQFKLLQKQAEKEISQLTFEHFATGHKLITDALAEFAGQRGIDLVLRKPYSIEKAGSADEFQLKLQFDTVLYSAPYLDMTDDFIAYLDTEYEPLADADEADAETETEGETDSGNGDE